MRITWFGHAAFLFETEGRRIIIDPYRSPDSGGYLPVNERADLVVVSHENDRYHSHLGQVLPPFHVIRALELPREGREVLGITFRAVHVFETPERKPEDEVTIVHFHAEELHVVFLGDLGHPLTAEEVAPLRGADVLLVAAGGTPTIDLAEMPRLLEAIGPKWVLPMHYKTPKINLNILPVERFLACLPDVPVDRPGRSWLEVDRSSLPMSRRIVVLEHAR